MRKQKQVAQQHVTKTWKGKDSSERGCVNKGTQDRYITTDYGEGRVERKDATEKYLETFLRDEDMD